MPAANRALGRDVNIYAASDPTGPVLGGLILTNGVTNANLYLMVDIILILSSIYHLQDANRSQLDRDNNPLQPGDYYVVTDGGFPPRLHRMVKQMLSYNRFHLDQR